MKPSDNFDNGAAPNVSLPPGRPRRPLWKTAVIVAALILVGALVVRALTG